VTQSLKTQRLLSLLSFTTLLFKFNYCIPRVALGYDSIIVSSINSPFQLLYQLSISIIVSIIVSSINSPFQLSQLLMVLILSLRFSLTLSTSQLSLQISNCYFMFCC